MATVLILLTKALAQYDVSRMQGSASKSCRNEGSINLFYIAIRTSRAAEYNAKRKPPPRVANKQANLQHLRAACIRSHESFIGDASTVSDCFRAHHSPGLMAKNYVATPQQLVRNLAFYINMESYTSFKDLIRNKILAISVFTVA